MCHLTQVCFVLRESSGEKKVPTFLTLIGQDTYEVLRNILSPEKPAEKTMDQIYAALKAHFEPNPILIAERHRFFSTRQREGETLLNFLSKNAQLELLLHAEAGVRFHRFNTPLVGWSVQG